jgi:hypothetical protein
MSDLPHSSIAADSTILSLDFGRSSVQGEGD